MANLTYSMGGLVQDVFADEDTWILETYWANYCFICTLKYLNSVPFRVLQYNSINSYPHSRDARVPIRPLRVAKLSSPYRGTYHDLSTCIGTWVGIVSRFTCTCYLCAIDIYAISQIVMLERTWTFSKNILTLKMFTPPRKICPTLF